MIGAGPAQRDPFESALLVQECEGCRLELVDLWVEILVYETTYKIVGRHQFCPLCAQGWINGEAVAV